MAALGYLGGGGGGGGNGGGGGGGGGGGAGGGGGGGGGGGFFGLWCGTLQGLRMSGIPIRDISTGGMSSISQSNLELKMQQLADLSVEDFLQLHGRRWHERLVQLHHTDASTFSRASRPLPHTCPTRRRLQRTRSIASGHSALLGEHQGAAAASPSHRRQPCSTRFSGRRPSRRQPSHRDGAQLCRFLLAGWYLVVHTSTHVT